jgi:hypothetical protein
MTCLGALGLTFAVNCQLGPARRGKVAVQGWDSRLGPLVSHRTFPGDCGLCHVPERWDVMRPDLVYDHEKETGFALEGAHREARCLRCHNDRGPVSAYVARGCGGCHPDPHASSLGLDCQRCHSQVSWRPQGLIAEHARTRFPLYGVHAVTPCESCHLQAPAGQYRGAPAQCELCHQKDLARATSPDHAASGWTTRCERCHTPTAWAGAAIRHDFFPLTGGHAGLQCTRCHTSGAYGPIPSDCYSCHRANYESAANHVAQSYSTTCQTCHTTAGWTGAAIRHDLFPLTGGHAGLQCAQCHTGGSYTSTPSDCYSCHQTNYQGAANHTALNLSHACTTCHTTTAWTPSTFRHTFPITGVHNVACSSCHTGGSASTFSCIDCHTHNRTDTDGHHDDVRGYSYDSAACYRCHPNGTR